MYNQAKDSVKKGKVDPFFWDNERYVLYTSTSMKCALNGYVVFIQSFYLHEAAPAIFVAPDQNPQLEVARRLGTNFSKDPIKLCIVVITHRLDPLPRKSRVWFSYCRHTRDIDWD